MYRVVAPLVGLIVASCAAISSADDVLLAQLYGNGVHAYYNGDYVTAYNQLTAAIQGGTIDPRAYYFRGLTDLRLGRQPDAVADFKKGAELETGDSNGVFPVSSSLARVQGPDREMLEQYREAAQVTAMQRQAAERQARYQERIDAEKTVLRHVEPTELMSPPSPDHSSTTGAEQSAATGKTDDPFAEPKPVPSKTEAPKPEEMPKSDDPFGAAAPKEQPAAFPGAKSKEAPKAGPAADANPFGETATKSKTAPAAAETSAPASAQRFTKVAQKLIQEINKGDSAAIEASFDAQMQQALPPDKATPFFRGLVAAAGKLKDAGVPQVTGSAAVMRVPSERGAWDFKITLDDSDKISGLLITPPTDAAKPAAKPAGSKPAAQPAPADDNPFK